MFLKRGSLQVGPRATSSSMEAASRSCGPEANGEIRLTDKLEGNSRANSIEGLAGCQTDSVARACLDETVCLTADGF